VTDLAAQTCRPCRRDAAPLSADERAPLLAELDSAWQIVSGHHLARSYAFADFKQALAFANAVGAVAEEQNHHPDLHLAWGKLGVEIWTHAIDGLHTSDFVLAAKCDRLYAAR
jgi:4a-hydroxytetrahydrobiopterin dehydratase